MGYFNDSIQSLSPKQLKLLSDFVGFIAIYYYMDNISISVSILNKLNNKIITNIESLKSIEFGSYLMDIIVECIVNIKFGESQNNTIYGTKANELQINMQCDDGMDIWCFSKSNQIFAENATKIVVNAENNKLINTAFHAQFAKSFNLTINHNGSITESIFYLNFTQNVTVLMNNDYSYFSDNILYIIHSSDFSMINKGHFLNNVLNGNNVTLFNISCIHSYSNCDGIWNLFNAESIIINIDKNNAINAMNTTNTIINGSNATDIKFNIGKHTFLHSMEVYANNVSSVTINVYGQYIDGKIIAPNSKIVNINCISCVIKQNNVTVTNTETVNFNLYTDSSYFTDNIVYGQFIVKKILINIDNENGYFYSNQLMLDSAKNVLILNNGYYYENIIYGDNIKTEFNLSCTHNFSVCSNYNDIFNLKNAHNVSLFIDSSQSAQSHNLSFNTHFIATNAKFVDIYIGEYILNTIYNKMMKIDISVKKMHIMF